MIKEKRKARRRRCVTAPGWRSTGEQRHGCVVSDVSDTGARIDVQDSKILPDHFVLLLTGNGSARRYCRVVWRKPAQVGVKFEHSLATLKPTLNGRRKPRLRRHAPKRDGGRRRTDRPALR